MVFLLAVQGTMIGTSTGKVSNCIFALNRRSGFDDGAVLIDARATDRHEGSHPPAPGSPKKPRPDKKKLVGPDVVEVFVRNLKRLVV